jgi:mannose-6-phosphate isomerase
MAYDWGSRTAIAEFLGHPSPSPTPQAELWIGAHASAPSMLEADGRRRTLSEWIAESPEARLGSTVCEEFGGRLPFLLKILAAESPLSLQAHPSREQARVGHAREDALGIDLSAPQRNYKDTNHKPEILCALGPFDALCGFRPVELTLHLLETLAVPSLAPVVDALQASPHADGLKSAFTYLLTLAPETAATLVGQLSKACSRTAVSGAVGCEQFQWTSLLAKKHPADVGVAASLLLNHVRLQPGEALFLPAGNLHSYLAGTGIELMASSDNVLRGGLTTKHVDIDELLAVVDFSDRAVAPVPVRRLGEHETQYVTDAADFRLSTISVESGRQWHSDRRGAELLLCVSGPARIDARGTSIELGRGESAFVGGDEGPYAVSGPAMLFRATVGDGAL